MKLKIKQINLMIPIYFVFLLDFINLFTQKINETKTNN